MKRMALITSVILLLAGCASSDSSSYSSKNLYNQYDLRFNEHASTLSNRVKTILKNNEWEVLYEGINRPMKMQEFEAQAWAKTSRPSDIPFEFIKAKTPRTTLTNNGSSIYIVISKLRDQKSSIAVTASSRLAAEQFRVEPYVKTFVKQLRNPLPINGDEDI